MRRLLAAAALLLLCGCGKAAPVTRTGFLLDTVITVTIYDGGRGSDALLEEVFALCAGYEKVFSRTDRESEVYRLNRAGGVEAAVSADLMAVLRRAVYYAELTGGRYDVTICPVVDLWDFTSETPSPPDPAALAAALPLVNYRNIVLGDGTAQLLGGAQVDLGSIAKGYIADRMADLLRDAGVRSAIIYLGGDIRVIGAKPDGAPFNIGVQKPFDQHGATIGIIEAADRSVVSSGVYERGFALDGVFYHHILDPDTGYPADTGIVSVTVVSDLSVDGDAISTGLFLLGPEAGLALADSLDGVEAILITEDGEEHFSAGFGGEVMYRPVA